jgi:hypothetical protein
MELRDEGRGLPVAPGGDTALLAGGDECVDAHVLGPDGGLGPAVGGLIGVGGLRLALGNLRGRLVPGLGLATRTLALGVGSGRGADLHRGDLALALALARVELEPDLALLGHGHEDPLAHEAHHRHAPVELTVRGDHAGDPRRERAFAGVPIEGLVEALLVHRLDDVGEGRPAGHVEPGERIGEALDQLEDLTVGQLHSALHACLDAGELGFTGLSLGEEPELVGLLEERVLLPTLHSFEELIGLAVDLTTGGGGGGIERQDHERVHVDRDLDRLAHDLLALLTDVADAHPGLPGHDLPPAPVVAVLVEGGTLGEPFGELDLVSARVDEDVIVERCTLGRTILATVLHVLGPAPERDARVADGSEEQVGRRAVPPVDPAVDGFEAFGLLTLGHHLVEQAVVEGDDALACPVQGYRADLGPAFPALPVREGLEEEAEHGDALPRSVPPLETHVTALPVDALLDDEREVPAAPVEQGVRDDRVGLDHTSLRVGDLGRAIDLPGGEALGFSLTVEEEVVRHALGVVVEGDPGELDGSVGVTEDPSLDLADGLFGLVGALAGGLAVLDAGVGDGRDLSGLVHHLVHGGEDLVDLVATGHVLGNPRGVGEGQGETKGERPEVAVEGGGHRDTPVFATPSRRGGGWEGTLSVPR